MSAAAPARRRVHVRVEGVVQGVGFRPFVHRLAEELGVAGMVRNDARGVAIEAEGPADAVRAFLERLVADAPPLAAVEAVRAVDAEPRGVRGFTIDASRAGAPQALVSADAATCDDCLRELFDPADRRFRYPFVNCTNCGPRFTIVRGVPYDRPRTTMAGFAMCDACRAEYADPADRRFHAQPNACPECGPHVTLHGGDAVPGRDAVARAAALLRDGAIVAVKGIGGYHLACRADGELAVARLRARKHREEKPFALMARDLAAAAALAEVGEAEAALLCSPARPIVLLARRPDAPVAAAVAQPERGQTPFRLRELGVMLPYSPLHHLLLADAGTTLVMTSGNVSDEPIAYRDPDALERLAPIADALLVHDRPIHTRTDDGVARIVRGRRAVLRRSRGDVPAATALPVACRRPVLGVGAELKSTFCVARGRRAWVGHHIGDLRTAETLLSFREGVEHFERLFAVRPEVVAHDLHPDYLSTAYALEREGVGTVAVQHHHAHLAACLAEHGVTGRAVGAIFDGTGHGEDGTAWGGEILAGDLRGAERVAHLWPVRLPGGDRAVREPWRMACAWLVAAGAGEAVPARLREAVAPERWDAVARMARERLRRAGDDERRAPLRRGGRAVRAARGDHVRGAGGDRARGASPIRRRAAPTRSVPRSTRASSCSAVRDDAAAACPAAAIAARFHRALASATAARVRGGGGGGGRRPGRALRRRVPESPAADLDGGAARGGGLRVLVPEVLPANDGGIAYGQVAVAAARGS